MRASVTLGAEYRDIVTGFVGVCTGRVDYLTGCNQALLAPRAKEGALRESAWFDVQRLERTKKATLSVDNSQHNGFDKAAPIR
jgi:hypothetical protein